MLGFLLGLRRGGDVELDRSRDGAATGEVSCDYKNMMPFIGENVCNPYLHTLKILSRIETKCTMNMETINTDLKNLQYFTA